MKAHPPLPARLVLWVALPMAHTSKVEKRLTMILDPARPRHVPTSRARFTAFALASAALVPLAMLHPVVEAQAASEPSGGPAQTATAIQLVGVTDATVRAGEWWSVGGKRLPGHPFNTGAWALGTKTTVQPGQIGRFFAFRLPPSLQNVPVLYDFPDYTLGGITIFAPGRVAIKGGIPQSETMRSIQIQSSASQLIYGAAFPATLAQTNVRVGVSSGPWATALTIHYRFERGAPVANVVSGSRSGQPAAIDLSGGNVKYSIQTEGPSRDHDFRLVAVDKRGHDSVLPATVSDSGTREQITARQPQNLSSLQAIRVETRPFAWTKFNDVALQPAPPTPGGTEGAKP